jgi:hypothetical protein
MADNFQMSADQTEIVARIPKEQRLTYTITPIAGGILEAGMVGDQLSALAALLEANSAKYSPSVKSGAYLTGISMLPNGAVKFELALLRIEEGSEGERAST